MADWSSLPSELLYSITLRLPTATDICRLRSVCTHWRSSVHPPPSSIPCYSIIPCSGFSYMSWGFNLTKRYIYALRPTSRDVSSSWIIKIEQDDDHNSTRLICPLTESHYKPWPQSFPESFSFMNFRLKELGEEYTLRHITNRRSNSMSHTTGEKVVALNNLSGDGFVLLKNSARQLLVYNSRDEKWSSIQDPNQNLSGPYDAYVDIILRGGRFYAVDEHGRLFLVNHMELYVTTVANSILHGYHEFLVNSDGQLLLVDRSLGTEPVDSRTFKFKVFRLDENAGKWIEISDLGDRMLFLCDYCTFSTSVSDTFGDDSSKTNHIFFTSDNRWSKYGFGLQMYDLKSGSSEPIIVGHHGYGKMFWPPPYWVGLFDRAH